MNKEPQNLKEIFELSVIKIPPRSPNEYFYPDENWPHLLLRPVLALLLFKKVMPLAYDRETSTFFDLEFMRL